MLFLGLLGGGSCVFHGFVLILIDKWLLLTLSLPDINRNSAVPAEVLLEKRGYLCSCSLLQLFYQVLTSLFFLRNPTQVLPLAGLLSLSGLAQGRLVSGFIPAILFMLVLSSHSYFVGWLSRASSSLASFLICWASVYRSRLEVVSFGLQRFP